MADKTIVQRIALEGGDAIKDQLKALGDAGEKAFKQIQNAAIKADFSKFSASLNKVGSDLATVTRRFALLGASITAGAAGATAAVIALAKAGGDAADQAGKAAEKTGLQVEAYGRLEFAAKQADVSNEQFVSGMSRLNKAIAEAASQGTKGLGQLGDAAKNTGSTITEGLGRTVETFNDIGVSVVRFGKDTKKSTDEAKKAVTGAAEVFANLGVKIKDANGNLRSNEAIIGDVAEAFSKMPDGALKSALAIELFGKSGAELLPFLNEGRDGLKALGDEATRLGIVFNKEQAKIGDDLGDSLDSLGKSAAGVRLQLGLLFAPAITVLAKGLTDIIVANKDAILQLGQTAARVFASVLGDLLHLLSGNSQNIKNPWIREWSTAIIQFGRDFLAVVETVVLPLFKGIHDGAQAVAEAINGIFGTDVTGGQLLIGVALLQLLGVFNLLISTSGAVIAAFRLIGTVLATIFSEGLVAAATGFFGAIIEGATAFLALVAGLISWPALLVAALIAAGVAAFVFWDDIVAGAKAAIAAIQTLFSAENLTAVFSGLLDGAKAAGELFVEAWKLQIQAVGVVFEGLATIVTGFVEGVVSAISGLAAQLLPSWDGISAAGGAIWAAISANAATAFAIIGESATALAGLLSPIWAGIISAGSTVWTTISGAATTAFNGIASVATTVFQTVFDTISSLAGSLADAFTGAVSDVAQAASDIASAIQRATDIAGDVQGAEALAAALVAPFQQAETSINSIMASIRSLVQGGFNALLGVVNSVAASVQAAISRILAALQSAVAEANRLRAAAGSSSSGSSGGGSQGFAGGGHVRGPGGPRSDSILARLSNGEYVFTAEAVKRIGVGVLNAWNYGKEAFAGFKGFKLGGAVDNFNRSMAIPRFAGGGLASAAPTAGSSSSSGDNTALFFQFPGTDRIFEAFTPTLVARQMQTAAVKAGLLSTGRKPLRGSK